jgi:hypothetical protein
MQRREFALEFAILCIATTRREQLPDVAYFVADLVEAPLDLCKGNCLLNHELQNPLRYFFLYLHTPCCQV